MFGLILIIVLIIFLSINSSKLKEVSHKNDILKKYINKLCKIIVENENVIDKIKDEDTLNLLKEYCKKTKDNSENEIIFAEDEKNVEINNEVINNIEKIPQKAQENQKTQEEKPKVYNKKVERNSENDKNTMILTTGSILIVFSAIVFLISTWSILFNSVKTVILALLMVVFFEASNIAKNKFKLKKASQTFFYIGMAYIPICLLSLSFFGLVGKYLSINGEGKYIYLFFTMLCTSVIYGAFYLKNNSKVLVYRKLDFARIISNFIFVCN